MGLPGFVAEASIYSTRVSYRLAGAFYQASGAAYAAQTGFPEADAGEFICSISRLVAGSPFCHGYGAKSDTCCQCYGSQGQKVRCFNNGYNQAQCSQACTGAGHYSGRFMEGQLCNFAAGECRPA